MLNSRQTKSLYMKKTFFFLAVLCSQITSGQILQNPDFESGTVPTNYNQIHYATGWSVGCALNKTTPSETPYIGSPDLADANCPTASMDMPFQGHINPRTTGTTNNRFARILGSSFYNPSAGIYGESIKGTLTEPLSTSYQYNLVFYTARWKASYMSSTTVQVQIVLRKDNDCSFEKIVYTTPDVPILNTCDNCATNNWSQFSTSFTLTAAECAVGYNQLEMRLVGPGSNTGPLGVCLDDVSLTKTALPKAQFSFQNTVGSTTINLPWGPAPASLICLPNVYINGSASVNESRYFLEIAEFNPSTATDIQMLYSNWIQPFTPVPLFNINLTTLINNDPTYSGVFTTNGIYRVRLGVGIPWHSVDHYFKADCNVKSGEGFKVEVYPVPVIENVKIELEEDNIIHSVVVYDLNYSVLKKESFDDRDVKKAELNLNDLKKGVYIIEINSEKGTERRQIFVG